MSLNKLLIGALAVQLIIVGTLLIAPAESRTQPAVAAFDHTNCQYPERWTNPADACDNSDPAVPECIKDMYSEAAEKACIDAFVKANQGTAEKRQAIKEHSEPFKPAQQQAAQCGGK
jgi:hypothetical protein